jgi:hypothetical protein
MKRWHWIFIALSPFLVAAILLIPPHLGGGTEQVQAQGGLSLSLDMDVTDGGPCVDIDDNATHGSGDSYQVAICIAGMPEALGAFSVAVTYDDTLNSSPNLTCTDGTCFDSNPDANAGTTTWGTPLGAGWTCNYLSLSPPKGDDNGATGPGNGEAYISCANDQGPFTFGDNETSGVLALISFTATHSGSDTLAFKDVVIGNSQSVNIGSCNPPEPGTTPMPCADASDTKSGTPAPTNTPTATPTATNTPCPDGICPTNTPTPKAWTKTPTPPPTDTPAPAEEPSSPPPPPPPPPPTGEQLPQVVPPATGSGPDGIPWASTAVWLLVAAGAVSVSLGGLYLRRARHR